MKMLGKDLTAGVFAIVVLAGAVMALGACNTTAGIGEDVASAGHAVTKAAEKVKDKL